jgi:chromosome partitioning protein
MTSMLICLLASCRVGYGAGMKTIVLHTPKGGSGKSTLAREIATMAVRSGLSAALADLDPQGTTSGWYQRRQSADPPLVDLGPAPFRRKMDELAKADLDLLVIDTPPAQPSFLPALLAVADLVLVPVRPTPDDLLAAAPIARSLAKHPRWVFVLSQVPSRTRMLASAVRQLAAIGLVAPAQITFRADYPAAAIDGSAAAELTGKAASESAELFRYIQTLIED